ncbi:MAG: glycosyltransferase [Bacteroidota bacterium]
MTEIVLILALLYLCLMIVFAVFASRAQYPSVAEYRPTVSIVIAARDEEANIAECLDSIVRLVYPRELLQVIIIDDASTDRTAELAAQYVNVHDWISIIHAKKTPHLKGKANALAQGIDATTGEIIMMTDADCIVPEGWVENTVKYYLHDNIGIVAGFTSLRARSMFECAQALDWFALVSVAAATARMGSPVTAVGNNLSFRRKAYDSVGGYSRLPPSLTEDFILVRSIVTQTYYRCIFPMDPDGLVESKPCQSLRELFLQKKRWFIGGLDMGWKQIAIFTAAFLLNGLIIVTLLGEHGWMGWVVMSGKCVADLLVLFPSLRTFSRWQMLRGFIAYELYSFLYVLIFPLVLTVSRSVVWKHRILNK